MAYREFEDFDDSASFAPVQLEVSVEDEAATMSRGKGTQLAGVIPAHQRPPTGAVLELDSSISD